MELGCKAGQGSNKIWDLLDQIMFVSIEERVT
jgi:hypothetical protein